VLLGDGFGFCVLFSDVVFCGMGRLVCDSFGVVFFLWVCWGGSVVIDFWLLFSLLMDGCVDPVDSYFESCPSVS